MTFKMLAAFSIFSVALAGQEIERMMSPNFINIGSRIKNPKILNNMNKVVAELYNWGKPSPLRAMMLNVELVLDFSEAQNEWGDVICDVMVRIHGPNQSVVTIKGDKPLGLKSTADPKTNALTIIRLMYFRMGLIKEPDTKSLAPTKTAGNTRRSVLGPPAPLQGGAVVLFINFQYCIKIIPL